MPLEDLSQESSFSGVQKIRTPTGRDLKNEGGGLGEGEGRAAAAPATARGAKPPQRRGMAEILAPEQPAPRCYFRAFCRISSSPVRRMCTWGRTFAAESVVRCGCREADSSVHRRRQGTPAHYKTMGATTLGQLTARSHPASSRHRRFVDVRISCHHIRRSQRSR